MEGIWNRLPLAPTRRVTLTLVATLAAMTLNCLTPACWARGSVSATASTSLCSYTVVVDEFDVSKCPAMNDHAQADGSGPGYLVDTDERSTRITPHARRHGGTDKTFTSTGGSRTLKNKHRHHNGRSSSSGRTNRGDRRDSLDGEDLDDIGDMGEENVGFNSQLKDIESKLIDEMVRSRELNSTLSRHENLLSTAQQTLQAYRANFSSVFRTMMLMERKLQQQRRINRSLNKKLANVILDVVEINNVMTHKLPTGDAARGRKVFEVESTSSLRSCPGVTDKTKHYKDCAEVYDAGHHASDIYYIKPLYAGCPIPVWCDMDSPGGGWLVFQRRRDGSVKFDRDWAEYRHGFGDISGEHWLGNDNLFLLTNQARYQLRVDLWDFSGNRVHAIYSNFKIDGERDQYRLQVSGYSGSAKDSLAKHNNKKFSTLDQDNDGRREASCAHEWEGGWWFDNCWFALLNGPYHNRSDVSWRGLAWNHWKREQLRASEMKFRPVKR
ncbi:fibrinogen C domain-containing protein 1-A [Aplysia californica]|uniref:Fibrinogen C domain-containing protein 1-A n=1 Tax=Aplysia californica TaxID=6500 RepID=A0ABM1AAC9_APLCA|nr:fibrinogen C domain-containing protein 1-A [Aplysia californica]